MFKILSFFFFAFLFYSCNMGQTNDCQRFKNGKFILRSELLHSTIIVDRNDSMQVESTNGDTAAWSVRWINDCEYELRYLGMTINSHGTIDKYLQTHYLRTKILQTEKDSYIFELAVQGVETKAIDTMKVYAP